MTQHWQREQAKESLVKLTKTLFASQADLTLMDVRGTREFKDALNFVPSRVAETVVTQAYLMEVRKKSKTGEEGARLHFLGVRRG